MNILYIMSAHVYTSMHAYYCACYILAYFGPYLTSICSSQVDRSMYEIT